MARNFLLVDPEEGRTVLKGLASPARVSILKLLHVSGPQNINDLAAALDLPQSTVSMHVQTLEDAGLIRTESHKARKGSQKICHPTFEEILIVFRNDIKDSRSGYIDVSMPIGLYTSFHVKPPCGMCSHDDILGLLDVTNTFLDPGRIRASLLWFTHGYVEYEFPKCERLAQIPVEEIEFSMELSSEVPGTSPDWPSDITILVNGVDVGTWTSPSDFGDQRGTFTPDWWKLSGPQHGKLKRWRISTDGTFVDGVRISDVTICDLNLNGHHSIRLRIAVREDAKHRGGLIIFGRGFGNYDQDIALRLRMRQ
jgi:predicted transcriptional regulator